MAELAIDRADDATQGVRRNGGAPPGKSSWSRIPWKRALVSAALVFAVFVPTLTDQEFRISVLRLAFINASLAASLVVSLGYAGLLNLSQGTFYGFGAYVTAILVTDHNVPLELAFFAAAAAGAAGALILGLASIRVRGDYFALVSLAFTIAAVQVMENWTSVTRGREGYFGIPVVSIFGFEIDSARSGYYACLGLLVFTCIVVALFVRTFAGRALLAARYDEVAAQAMGINVRFTKLLSMGVSGALAGLSGSFLVATVLFVKPSSFDLNASFTIMLWVIIGGMASLTGAVIVAIGLTVLTEEFRQLYEYRLAVVGLVVLAAVFYRGGVFSDWLVAIRGRGDRTMPLGSDEVVTVDADLHQP